MFGEREVPGLEERHVAGGATGVFFHDVLSVAEKLYKA